MHTHIQLIVYILYHSVALLLRFYKIDSLSARGRTPYIHKKPRGDNFHLLTVNHGVKYSRMIELTLNGIVLEYDFRALIVTGAGAAEAAARSRWPIIAQGEICLHLGVALFDRPFVFTPMRVITERQ